MKQASSATSGSSEAMTAKVAGSLEFTPNSSFAGAFEPRPPSAPIFVYEK
jgi:hypothetical protein